MNPILKNILAVIVGAVIGSIVNGAIIMISGSLIPPPAGTDISTEEGLKMAMPLFEPKHFLMPFLAHALGTFVGALCAAFIARPKPMRPAIIVGLIFLLGGAYMVSVIPSPLWYNIVDLALAYIPMAYLAARLVMKKN